MIKAEEESKVLPLGPVSDAGAELPYAVELWDWPKTGPEKVLGRASGALLARAIFTAAQSEYLGRRLILRRGVVVLDQIN